jgi:hypothetical protein
MSGNVPAVPVAAAPASPSRERSARAALWSLVDLAGGQASSFLVFLVMARVIGPAQCGVFALAWSLLSLLAIVQYYGFADAIVQRAAVDVRFLDTVFWCDMALAVGLIAIIQVGALPVARCSTPRCWTLCSAGCRSSVCCRRWSPSPRRCADARFRCTSSPPAPC